MSTPHDHEALWLKAKLFLNLALDEEENRSFDERALWTSLALELLAKAALARVSPLLVAVPTEDGTNILIAAGLVRGEARFESVKAHTLFVRCSKAFKPFDDKQALAISRARNDYLHGGEPGFTRIPPDAWWPRFWAQAVVLVHAQDRTVEELVGHARSDQVEQQLTRNATNLERRAEMLIERARQRLDQHRSGTMPARLATEWDRPVDLTAGLAHRSAHACPACQNTGYLEGDDVIDQVVRHEQIAEDDADVWMDLTVASDYFTCPECRLVLDSYDLLVQAGLPGDFADEGDYGDYAETEYGND